MNKESEENLSKNYKMQKRVLILKISVIYEKIKEEKAEQGRYRGEHSRLLLSTTDDSRCKSMPKRGWKWTPHENIILSTYLCWLKNIMKSRYSVATIHFRAKFPVWLELISSNLRYYRLNRRSVFASFFFLWKFEDPQRTSESSRHKSVLQITMRAGLIQLTN